MPRLPFPSLLLVLPLVALASARADLVAVRDYGAGPNPVDLAATSDIGARVSLATFRAAVAAAHDSGLGGVLDFDAGAVESNRIVALFGAASARGLTISTPGAWQLAGPASDRTAVSGTRYLASVGSPHHLFHFDVADGVTHAGATILSRSGVGSAGYTATAWFSDGASVFSDTLSFTSPGNTNAGADTFVGFRAPAGSYLVRLEFQNANSSSWRSLDDLAVIVDAEPRLDPPPPLSSEKSFREVARDYAAAMLAHGRDRYGAVHSPLFASMLDRLSLSLPANPRGTLPNLADQGVRSHDRAWNGSNPQHDQGLYRLLYALAADEGDPAWAAEADAALTWFLARTPSPVTGLFAWGEHLGWDLRQERTVVQDHQENQTHEFFDLWHLWPELFRLDPAASRRFAQGLWDHQIYSQTSGDFSRHAKYHTHAPERQASFPRHGGHYILAWAHAYACSDPATAQSGFERADMLAAIGTILDSFDRRRKAATDALSAGTGSIYDNVYWLTNDLSYAAEITDAAALLTPFPEAASLRARLLDSAARSDAVILSLPHDPAGAGFVQRAYADTLVVGDPRAPGAPLAESYTGAWSAGYGSPTHSETANLLLRRHRQTGLAAYRELALATADFYLGSLPDFSLALHPVAFAEVLDLLLASHRLTGDLRYLERARTLGTLAIDTFFDRRSPLPRVTSWHSHYESITGGPALAASLLDLDRALHPRPLSWSDWVDQELDPAGQLDPAARAPEADPDSGGAQNLLRYALGLPARGPVAPLVPELRDGRLALHFLRRTDMPGVVLRVESSSDLRAWSETDVTLESTGPASGGLEPMSAQVALADAEGGRRFLRLRVELTHD